jgi:hypothetical protein
MAKRNCNIYGPNLSEHEEQGREIANVGMQSVRGTGVTGKQEKSTGPDVSKNGLERMEDK